jgi:hypothetical protein
VRDIPDRRGLAHAVREALADLIKQQRDDVADYEKWLQEAEALIKGRSVETVYPSNAGHHHL